MTEHCWLIEVAHHRHTELLERVGEDDHLRPSPELIEEGASARQRIELSDDLIDLGHGHSVLSKCCETTLHQRVIVRFFTGGATQVGNPGRLGNGDPDLWDQNPFSIEGDERLLRCHGNPLWCIRGESTPF